MSLNLKNELKNLREAIDQLEKIDEKFKDTKQHARQLRIFFEDIEKSSFNIFNYTLQIEGKPLKEKMTKLKGTYIKKNQKGGEVKNIETIETIEKKKEEIDFNNYGINLDYIEIED